MSPQALPAPAKQLFHYLFEQASLGIAVEDLEGQLLLANPALCSMLGYTEKELCGMSCSQFSSPEDAEDDWALFQQLRAGLIDQYSLEKRYVRKDGAQLWGHLHVSLLKEGNGGSPLVFAFVEEITERKLAEQELARSHERFRLAVEASKSVGWEWDIKSGRDSWFGDLQTMFGIPSDTFVGRVEDFYSYVHPEDRPMVAKAVSDARHSRNPYAVEFRVVRLDETVRWVSATGQFYYDSNGDAERMVGLAADITERKRVHEALRESEERFRLAAQAGRMFAYEWDATTDVIVRSAEVAQILGIDEATRITGQQMLAKVHPDDREKLLAAVAALSAEKPYLQVNFRMGRSDGSVIWVERNSRADFDEQGRLLRMVGMVADITERKRAEEALKRSESNYRLFVAQSSEGIFCQELERPIPVDLPEDEQVQRILHESYMAECNDALARMYGMSQADFVGKRLTETLDAENLINIELTRDYIRGGYRVVDRQSHEVDPQGNPKVFLNSMIGVVENNMLLRTWGIQRDITDRYQAEQARVHAEQALRESEQRFRLATQAGKMYAYEWDVASDMVVRSEEYVKILGFGDQPKQLTRQQLLGRVHPDDRALFASSVDQLCPENPTTQIRYRVSRSDGSVVWLEKSARAFFDEQGSMLRVTGMVADITERKRAEEALRASEERLRLAQQAAHIGTFEWNIRTGANTWTPELEAMYGLARGGFGGTQKAFENLVHPDDLAGAVELINSSLRTGEPNSGEWRVVWPDGTVHWIAGRWQVFMDASGEPSRMSGVSLDVTDRKLAEEKLQEYERAVEGSDEMITVLDREYRYLIANRQFLKMRKMTREQVVGRFAHEVWGPDVFEAIVKPNLDECFKGTAIRHRQKNAFPELGERDVLASYFPIEGPKGIDRVVCVSQDITDRKRAEDALSDMTRKLIESQEQERARIGRELHDDINQRLALLALEVEQLQQNPSELESRTQGLRKRMTELSNDVQALSHDLHSSKLEYLGVVAGMKSWCKEFSERQKVKIDFRSNVPSPLPRELGLSLFRVLQEALQNFVKHSGVKRVEVQLLEDRGEIHLVVCDLGKGFDLESALQGRGLGLISMRERVRLVEGTIAIDSKPMGGTTIHVRVPLQPGPGSQQAAG